MMTGRPDIAESALVFSGEDVINGSCPSPCGMQGSLPAMRADAGILIQPVDACFRHSLDQRI